MILQNTDKSRADNETHFVIKNIEHAALAAQIAINFGNDEFDLPEPNEEIIYLAAHHDHGWQSLDESPPINNEVGLPFNLVLTPFEYLILASKASPDYNEKHSAFCGLVSSMHTCGLYNGRYGLSNAVSMDWVPQSMRSEVDIMLAAEIQRQARLKLELAEFSLDDESLIFNAYKFLQFVDACALYFNREPAGQRGNSLFENVPMAMGKDVTIEVSEEEDGHYRFSPYPFKSEKLELYFEGRYMQAGELHADSGNTMNSFKKERQELTLTAN